MVELTMKRAVILEKPSGSIAIGGNLNTVERKFFDGFLYAAKETLKKNIEETWFSIPLADLKKFFGLEENKNNKQFKEIVEKLSNIKVEYNILGKDKEVEGYAHCLDNVEYITDKETKRTIVKFSIPFRVRKSMIDPNGIYASINLVLVRGINGKYALILYELVKDYEKVQIPMMSIKQFRKIFGIESKYPKMPDVRNRVLNSAVKELNNNDNIEFLVDYKLIKQGNTYTHIKFIVKSKPAKLKLQQQAKKILKKENPELEELLELIPENYRKDKNITRLLLAGIKEKGFEYTKAQIEYVNRQEKVQNYGGYLKKAIVNDFGQEIQVRAKEEKQAEGIKQKWAEIVGKKFRYENGKIYVVGENFFVTDDENNAVELRKDAEKWVKYIKQNLI